MSSNLYKGTNRRSMGIVNSDIFLFDEITNPYVIIRFDRYGFYINGTKIDRSCFVNVEASKKPESPNNPVPPEMWTYPDYFMEHFQNPVDLSFGSEEGTSRSYAFYEYIKYHKVLD